MAGGVVPFIYFLVQVQSSEMDLVCMECQLFIVERNWKETDEKG